MFDFEKLEVYQICKQQNVEVLKYLQTNTTIDPYLKETWKKASMEVVKQMVEGVGRIPKNEKKGIYYGSPRFCVRMRGFPQYYRRTLPLREGKNGRVLRPL